MNELKSKISIKVNDKVYLKNPITTVLGQKLISGSIDVVDTIGYPASKTRAENSRMSPRTALLEALTERTLGEVPFTRNGKSIRFTVGSPNAGRYWIHADCS